MRVSKISLFLFILAFNYISLRVIIFPYLYNAYGAIGIYYLLMICFGIITFFLFLPKRVYAIDYKKNYVNSKFKYLFNFCLALRIIIGLTISTYIIQDQFFNEYSFLAIFVGFLFVISIISTLKPSEVIQISTLFSVIVLVAYLYYVYKFIDLDFGLWTKNLNFKFDIMLFILPYCLIFDNSIYFLTSQKEVELSRKPITLAVTISCLILLFEYMNLTLSSGGVLFSGDLMVGFKALTIESVSRYNGNFRYIYILMLGISCVFKFSYFLSLIKQSIRIKKKKIFYTIFISLMLLLGVLAPLIISKLRVFLSYFIITSFLLGGVLIIWIFKEAYHVKKAKE